MRHSVMILVLMACVGCAGTQSGAAFTIRPAAHAPDPRALTPNKAAEHEANLQRAIQRATEQQESEDGLQLKCPGRVFEDVTSCVTVPHFEFIVVCE